MQDEIDAFIAEALTTIAEASKDLVAVVQTGSTQWVLAYTDDGERHLTPDRPFLFQTQRDYETFHADGVVALGDQEGAPLHRKHRYRKHRYRRSAQRADASRN
ncbi:MAG: hypothetical protein RIG84_04495 [Roseovarius sp.]